MNCSRNSIAFRRFYSLTVKPLTRKRTSAFRTFPFRLAQGVLDVKRRRYTEEQMIRLLKEHEAGSTIVAEEDGHGRRTGDGQ